MPARQTATKIVSKLQNSRHEAYFAGGWVRDFLLGLPSDDIDIATSASIEEIQALFPKTIPVGVAFGIVIVVEEDRHFEVATFRKEMEYLDGRRPTRIEKASKEEDALRRDFTINGMFFDPIKEELLDFVEGKADLKKGLVRAIGDPHSRFLEDRLRMIRAVRYAVRFNFTIDPATESAILDHASALFPSVAIERVWQEFLKLSRFATFSKGLKTLYRLRLLQTVFPSLQEISEAEIERRLSIFPLFPIETPLIVELAQLFPDDPLEKHLELCDYMKVSRKEKEHIEFLHRAKSLLSMPLEWQKGISDYDWALFYADPLSDLFLKIYNSPVFHTIKKEELSVHIGRIREKKPFLVSKDLIAEGIAPGPALGLLLKEGEKLSVNLKIDDKKLLIEALRKGPLWPK